MSFESYVCWKPQDIDQIAPIDVASIEHTAEGDSAVFVATHHPLHLTRLAGVGATEGQLINEHDLLSEFSRPVGNDPQITIITGAVGTGKSHMVKWLHAGCTDRNGWHQVYIEKRNTNLRRVIETILSGLSGPRISELREQVKVASSSIRDLDEAKRKVLHELSFFVEYPSGGAAADGEHEKEARRQLPHLLNDPVLSNHLLRSDGAVHRITRLGLEGLQRDDENEHDLFFSETDLPLQPEDLLDASKPAQNAIKRLARSERLRSTAVEVLNRELAAAKVAVFLGSGVELTNVFDEVRQELAAQDLELVLYIEDLVLLHGIDKELAQVFTEGRGGSGDRCGMRVVIAVTEGYLASGLETLTSRAQHYSLNLRLGSDVSADEARTFVGRYLNANRVGVERLRSAWADAVDEEWVPNACDTCDHREPCHMAFGADANGYGYYPLNGIAVDRLVKLADSATSDEGRFDPRKVLRHVVRDPLRDAADAIPAGRFPSASFAAAVDPRRKSVSVEVRARLTETVDGDRRTTLLGFWAPEPVKAVVNVDPIVHRAFRLPEFAGAGDVEPDIPDRGTPSGRQRPQHAEFPDIDDWANEAKVLPSGLARSIRQVIFDTVIEAVRQGPSGVRVKGQSRKYHVGPVPFEVDSVRIEAAQGGGAEVERAFEIKITRSSKMAVLLKAVLSSHRLNRWPVESETQYADLVELVDGWANELVRTATTQSVDVEPAIRVLALASQPDIAEVSSAGESLERALIHRIGSEERTPARSAWSKVARQGRREAIAVIDRVLTGAKGGGASSFLDGAVLATQLDKARGIRELGKTLKGSQSFVDLQRRLRDQQETTAEKSWQEVGRLIERLTPHVDSGARWDRFRADVDQAVASAHDAGLLSMAGAREDLAGLAAAVPEDAAATMSGLVRKISSQDRELWDLVPDPVPALEALLEYCERADELIDGVESRLNEDEGEHQDGISLGTAVVAFRELADTLDEVVGEAS